MKFNPKTHTAGKTYDLTEQNMARMLAEIERLTALVNPKGTRTVYSCGVDWQHEIGQAEDLEGTMPLYSSVERLKKDRTCWAECGIVQLNLSKVAWI